MNKIQKAAELVKTLVGCPYIFGAVGQECTVKYRKSVINNRSDYAIKIKQLSCAFWKTKDLLWMQV